MWDKRKSKALATSLGIRVPFSHTIQDSYVFKPVDGHSGNGVVIVSDPSKYFIEELIVDENGSVPPRDFKCFVFNGELKVVGVRSKVDGIWGSGFYSYPDWNELELMTTGWRSSSPPSCLKEMADAAVLVASHIDLAAVRVDFYATSKGCVFGELCVTPGCVLNKNFTEHGDKLLGSWLGPGAASKPRLKQ